MPYIRKAHDRIVGGRVVRVKAARTNKPYTGPKIGPLAKGTLSKFGYKASASDRVRRAALVKAIAAYGPRRTLMRLAQKFTAARTGTH